MRETFSREMENGRVLTGPYGSAPGSMYGAFNVRGTGSGSTLYVIVGSGEGWEHVSVSNPRRIPNWNEMCRVKSLIWIDSEVVMQLHPAESDYVNVHQNCLHLWRPTDQQIPLPPRWMV